MRPEDIFHSSLVLLESIFVYTRIFTFYISACPSVVLLIKDNGIVFVNVFSVNRMLLLIWYIVCVKFTTNIRRICLWDIYLARQPKLEVIGPIVLNRGNFC